MEQAQAQRRFVRYDPSGVEVDVGSLVETIQKKLEKLRFNVMEFGEILAELWRELGCEYYMDRKVLSAHQTEYPWEEFGYEERAIDTVRCKEGDITVEVDIMMNRVVISDGKVSVLQDLLPSFNLEPALAILHFSEPKVVSIRVLKS